MHMACRTVRGALRLDHVTAAQVIGRNYTAPVKKEAKYGVNSVYEDYRSTIRATTSLPVLPFCGGEYTVTVLITTSLPCYCK